MSPALRIFLCDDVPELRVRARYGLEEDEDLQVVGEAGDAQAGIDGVRRLLPDVIVLDLSMPGMDGLEAIPRMREVAPAASIVVFSGFASERMASAALKLGASQYVEKGEPLDRLRETVRLAARV